MIYLVHGDDVANSRRQLTTIYQNLDNKAEGKCPKIEFTISEVTPRDIISATNSIDMFSPELVVEVDITDLASVGMKELAETLEESKKTIPQTTTLVFYSSKNVSKRNLLLKNAPVLGIRVIESTERKNSNVFAFIDALFTGNRKKTYLELEKLAKSGEDEFYLLSMIQYGLRNIAYKIFESPELKKVSPFAKRNLEVQSKNFNQQSTKELYSYIYEIEKRAKSGNENKGLMIPLIVEKVLTYF